MTEQTMWILIVIVAAIVAAALGFLAGRRTADARGRITDLEQEVAQNKEALNHYRQDVKAHFDHTAALFATMAGSYKDLFEHLSHGYENLAGGSARELMGAKVDSLLQDADASAGVREQNALEEDGDKAQSAAETEASAVRAEELEEASSPQGEAENLPVIEGEAVVEEIVSRPAAAEESYRVEESADADLPLITDVVPESPDSPADADRREPSIVAAQEKDAESRGA